MSGVWKLLKNGKFKETDALEFKFECAQTAKPDGKANLNQNSREKNLTVSDESVNLSAEHAVCGISNFDATNSNLNKAARKV